MVPLLMHLIFSLFFKSHSRTVLGFLNYKNSKIIFLYIAHLKLFCTERLNKAIFVMLSIYH